LTENMPDKPDMEKEQSGGPTASEIPPAPVAAPPKPRPARRPLPSPLAVIVATLGLFLVVLTLLTIQLRNGRDPALGPGPVIQVVGKPGAKGSQAKTQATAIVSRTSPAPPP
jgi:hypothetical protein